jgi:hypothetical protein
MPVDRDLFFAQLDGLTEREIEERLPSWDMERLALVQEYVEQRGLAGAEAAQPDQAEVVRDTVLAADTARRANARATAALILSVGAMLAAILCGVIVVLR